MFAARAVAAFAVGAEILPGGFVGIRIDIEVLLFLADVAGVAAFVPDLDQHVGGLVRIGDVHIVEPLLLRYIPGGRQHHDASVGERGEVMLDAPASQRIVDAMFLRLAREIGFGDVVDAVPLAQRVAGAAQRDCPREKSPFTTAGAARCTILLWRDWDHR